MWTPENRASHDRGKLRCPRDVTDDESAPIAPPVPPAKHGGRGRSVDVREVVNGLTHSPGTGRQWRAIPKDLPPRGALVEYFDLWDHDGTQDRIRRSLYVKCREAMGQKARQALAGDDAGEKLFADGACQGPIFEPARKKILLHLETEIVKRSDTAAGFEVIPRRGVVQKTFAWLGRRRSLAKDFDNRARTARAFLLLASIRPVPRKLCLNVDSGVVIKG